MRDVFMNSRAITGRKLGTARSANSLRLEEMVLKAKSSEGAVRKRAIADVYSMMQRLLSKVSYKYARNNDVPLDDVWQEASIGLMRAIDTWVPRKGSGFVSWANMWMSALARRVGMTMHTKDGNAVGRHQSKDPFRLMVSLDAPRMADNNESEITLYDLISVDPNQIDEISAAEAKMLVRNAMVRLKPKHQDILRRRMEEEAFHDIGLAHNLSRERVRQMYIEAQRIVTQVMLDSIK